MCRRIMISLLLLAGCASIADGRPTGDTKNWNTYRVEVDGNIVSFNIPRGGSRAFPERSVPQRIDSSREGVFDEIGSGPYLLRRYWDYKKGRFADVDGTLWFYIALQQSKSVLTSPESLRNAIEDSNRLFAMKMFLEEGRPRASDKALEFELEVVAGKQGLRVTYEISPDSYVVAVDEHHFLDISYGAGGFRDPAWRADALAAAKAIVQSIHIEPKH